MADFCEMTNAQPLDIINYRNNDIKSHEDVKAARSEYIARLSKVHSDKAEEMLKSHQETAEPEPETARKETAEHNKMPEKLVVITLEKQEKEEGKTDITEKTEKAVQLASDNLILEKHHSVMWYIARVIYSVGVFILCADAFATFLVSMAMAVLSYSPVMNFYVGGAILWLALAIMAWYLSANGKTLGKVLLRGIIISEIIMGFMGNAQENAPVIALMTVLFFAAERVQGEVA